MVTDREIDRLLRDLRGPRTDWALIITWAVIILSCVGLWFSVSDWAMQHFFVRGI